MRVCFCTHQCLVVLLAEFGQTFHLSRLTPDSVETEDDAGAGVLRLSALLSDKRSVCEFGVFLRYIWVESMEGLLQDLLWNLDYLLQEKQNGGVE